MVMACKCSSMISFNESKSTPAILSWDGAMGRDDYFKSLLWRTFPIIIIEFAFRSWIPGENAHRFNFLLLIAAVWTFLMVWPVIARRKSDLGSKLSDGWLYIFLINSVASDIGYGYIFKNPNVNYYIVDFVLTVLMIVSFYPGCRLLFVPGKKYARFRHKADRLNQSTVKRGGAKVTFNDT